jgi:hypothetical protein
MRALRQLLTARLAAQQDHNDCRDGEQRAIESGHGKAVRRTVRAAEMLSPGSRLFSSGR